MSKPAAGTSSPRLRFRVPLEASRLLRARDRLRDYLSAHCTDEALVDDLVLCIDEACANAIRHSGASDPLEIDLGFDGTDLVAVVRDHGCGFDLSTFDPSVDPDPGSVGGRGLVLIARLADEFNFSTVDGCEVRVVMKDVAHCLPPAFETGLAGASVGAGTDGEAARARALLEEIDEGFVAFDWEYRYTYANEMACALLGASREDLVGLTPWQVWPTAFETTPAADALRAAMEYGAPSIIEQRGPDGRDWLEDRLYPTRSGVCIYFREINERKRSQAALLESEDRYRVLVEMHPDAVMVHTDGTVVFVNPAAVSLFGADSADQLVGRQMLDLIHPEERSLVAQRMAAASEGSVPSVELRMMRLDGRLVIVESRAARIDFGSKPAVQVLLRDITRRKAADAERDGLLDELGRRAAFSEALNDIGLLIHSTLDADEVCQRALDHGVRMLEADAGVVQTRQESKLLVRYVSGLPPDDVGLLLDETEAPAATQAVRTMLPVALYDDGEGAFAGSHFFQANRFRSVVAVPLVTNDVASGCIAFYRHDVRPFDGAEVDFVRQLGAALSQAVENALLFDAEDVRLRRTAQELESLRVLALAAATLSARMPLRDVLVRLADLVYEAVEPGRLAIWLWEPLRGELRLVLSKGDSPLPVDSVWRLGRTQPQARGRPEPEGGRRSSTTSGAVCPPRSRAAPPGTTSASPS